MKGKEMREQTMGDDAQDYAAHLENDEREYTNFMAELLERMAHENTGFQARTLREAGWIRRGCKEGKLVWQDEPLAVALPRSASSSAPCKEISTAGMRLLEALLLWDVRADLSCEQPPIHPESILRSIATEDLTEIDRRLSLLHPVHGSNVAALVKLELSRRHGHVREWNAERKRGLLLITTVGV